MKKPAFLFICITFNLFGTLNVNHLSLEEKIGQLLIVHFHGEIANNEARTLIQDLKVSGIIFYNWANSLNSFFQVQQLCHGLQQLTKNSKNQIPLFLTLDQEGGRVRRLTHDFYPIPSYATIAKSMKDHEVLFLSRQVAKELKKAGINMNLAPVVDVNSNPFNPVIGDRSFSADPYTVSRLSKLMLQGFQNEGLIGTLKHYPGYGDVELDPHEDLPICHKTLEELQEIELKPYYELGQNADVIMTAHLLVPALDPINCATISAKILSYLRDKIGFNGIIMADSLIMEGVIRQSGTIEQAAVDAINAGCDILLLGGKLLNGEKKGLELTVEDVKKIYLHLIDAVKNKQISEDRIDQAIKRILHLKALYL